MWACFPAHRERAVNLLAWRANRRAGPPLLALIALCSAPRREVLARPADRRVGSGVSVVLLTAIIASPSFCADGGHYRSGCYYADKAATMGAKDSMSRSKKV